MKLSLIVAMAENRVIGRNNQMPWHLSADLKHFKQITLGHPVIMGRLTHEAIGRPLPGRTNIVISRNPAYQAENCLVMESLASAMDAGCNLSEEVFVIGGGALYAETLPIADLLYLTQLHQAFEGDTFFPAMDPADWLEVERQDIDDDSSAGFHYSFLKLQRRK
jgi:dihydrofolate reductase